MSGRRSSNKGARTERGMRRLLGRGLPAQDLFGRPDVPDRPGPSLLSLEDVADRLHKSARWLRDWLRKNPTDPDGNPFYIPLGRTKVFNEKDFERICAALRGEEHAD